MVKYTSIDKNARTATFDVGGKTVVRRIPAQFEGTIDDYLAALSAGLEIEGATAAIQPKPIATPSARAGEAIVKR